VAVAVCHSTAHNRVWFFNAPGESRGVPELELYDREDCPYSKRVRDTLDELGLAYDETLVPDAHKNRTEVEELTGQTGVPVLFDDNADGGFLTDTDEIVSHLERQYA